MTAEPSAAAGTVERRDRHPATWSSRPSPVVDRLRAEARRASIDDARIIVAGGRGVGGPDGFGLVEDLADALGGAVGATRAAVDSGWIPL